MRSVIVDLEAVTLYQQRRPINAADVPKLKGESADDYERRVWPETANWTKDGKMYIPAMAFHKAFAAAAKRLNIKIPGESKATYTKFFVSDVMVSDNVILENVTRQNLEGTWVYVPGQPGSAVGTKVWKCFPQASHWKASVHVVILEDKLTKEVFEEAVKKAGSSIGIGVWRPERGGLNGRFMPVQFHWTENVQEDQFLKKLAKRS